MILLVKLLLTLFVFLILFLMVAPASLFNEETPLQRKVIKFLEFVITFFFVLIMATALQAIWTMM